MGFGRIGLTGILTQFPVHNDLPIRDLDQESRCIPESRVIIIVGACGVEGAPNTRQQLAGWGRRPTVDPGDA